MPRALINFVAGVMLGSSLAPLAAEAQEDINRELRSSPQPTKWSSAAGALRPLASESASLAAQPIAAMSKSLGALRPEQSLSTRGSKEESLYSRVSPGVVLVVTKDSLGSGSLLSRDGTVLTCWHVVKGWSQIGVIFKPKIEGAEPSENDVFMAEVVRVDEQADLALLKVRDPIPTRATAISLGSMNEIRVGSDVHAIGHPTGESWTYTRGLVSQIRRDYNWQTASTHVAHKATVIQTQTPINPGSSGGALLSDQGTLLGVNAFAAEGEALNFAVAVPDIQRFLASRESRGAGRTAPRARAVKQACEVRVGERERDEELKAFVSLVDIDCDGKADGAWLEPFKRDEPNRLWFDSNEDGRTDIIFVDEGRDGKWDRSYHDSDFDGTTDLVGVHADGTLTPSSYRKFEG